MKGPPTNQKAMSTAAERSRGPSKELKNVQLKQCQKPREQQIQKLHWWGGTAYYKGSTKDPERRQEVLDHKRRGEGEKCQRDRPTFHHNDS